MPSRRVAALFAYCVLVLSAGCITTNEAKIVGTYRVSTACVDVTMVIKSDHSFEQTAKTHDGNINQLRGVWNITAEPKGIILKPFLDFSAYDHGKQVEFAIFPPEATGSAIEMGPVMIRCQDGLHEVDYIK
jgi:hypothetical protein